MVVKRWGKVNRDCDARFDPVLKGPAQRAINCCVAWQHTAGGFRYQARTPGDLSVSGWFVQTLKSGYTARGGK
jgi:hypothetical protein